MGIQITAKQDYSILFSGLNGSGSRSAGLNKMNPMYSINFSDYASIKNGSYGKLLKAYYKQEEGSESAGTDSVSSLSSLSKTRVDAQVKQELTEVKDASDKVRDSAAALMEKGSKSVFKDEDMDKIYKTVSSLVEDYNSLVQKGMASPSQSVERYTDSMTYGVEGYEKELNTIGITIGRDNKLSINKDTFMKAAVEEVKGVFNGNKSISAVISSKAAAVGNTAYSESNKTNLYTVNGTYSQLASGNMLNSIV